MGKGELSRDGTGAVPGREGGREWQCHSVGMVFKSVFQQKARTAC